MGYGRSCEGGAKLSAGPKDIPDLERKLQDSFNIKHGDSVNLINQYTKNFMASEAGGVIGVKTGKETTAVTFTVVVPGGGSVKLGEPFYLKSQCFNKYISKQDSKGTVQAAQNSNSFKGTKLYLHDAKSPAHKGRVKDFAIVGIKAYDGHWFGVNDEGELKANRRTINDGARVHFSIFKLSKTHPKGAHCGNSHVVKTPARTSRNSGVRGLSLSNGWAPYGHGYEAPSTTKSGDLCVVSGLIKRSGMKNPLLTLPSDCRPNKRVIFNLNNHEGTLRVDVLPNGQVHYVTGTYRHSWLNLDGINFAVANRHTLPLRSSWRAYGGSYGTPTYTKTGSVCEVEGLLRGGSWSGHLAELPSNCRPKKRLIFNMNNHAKTCRVDVHTNGRIQWHAGGRDHHWVSLGGMIFSTDNGSNLPLASRWSNYGGSYGSATVAKSGNLCLVSGLVRGGHWGHTIVTLPSDCRPKGRLIFNMNNHGKTARVDVMTNGQVRWVAGGRDHHWISLTGITIHKH
jgi:hypothetical protein